MIQATGNLVCILPDDAGGKEKKARGVIMPQSIHDPAFTGVIVSKGPGLMTEKGTYLTESGIKVGQRVLFKRYTAYEIEDEGVTYCLLPEEDVLCLIDKKQKVESTKHAYKQ